MPRGKYERKRKGPTLYISQKPKSAKAKRIVLTDLQLSDMLNAARKEGEEAGLMQQQQLRDNNPEVVQTWDAASSRFDLSPALNHTNPKTLTGQQKVPVLSVVPPTSIIAQATAMRYGAYLAPKVDGTRGYGPYNWRDQPIEAHIYVDAAMRHLMQWFDGEDHEIIADDEGRAVDCVSHLAFALATIGILLDAKANDTLIDDRPKVRKMAASNMLKDHKLARYEK